MRPSSILLLQILMLLAVPAAAQTAIHRCIGANGSPVFTDQPCAALNATPVNPPTRAVDDAGMVAPPTLCAADRQALRQAVIDAFAERDANRLAGLMLWSGYGHAAAVADIRSLAALMRQPLLDIDPGSDPTPARPASADTLDDPFATHTPPAPPPASHQLVLHTAGNDGSGTPHERRFDIVRRAGCLWLRNAD